jgi:hypothetical protein
MVQKEVHAASFTPKRVEGRAPGFHMPTSQIAASSASMTPMQNQYFLSAVIAAPFALTQII